MKQNPSSIDVLEISKVLFFPGTRVLLGHKECMALTLAGDFSRSVVVFNNKFFVVLYYNWDSKSQIFYLPDKLNVLKYCLFQPRNKKTNSLFIILHMTIWTKNPLATVTTVPLMF